MRISDWSSDVCSSDLKQSIVLDLKSAAGKKALLELARDADVIVENFAPGVMDRLGMDHATLAKLNPRLIYASSSGFGRDGPYRAYPAMDLTIQAMTCAMHTTDPNSDVTGKGVSEQVDTGG